MSRLVDGLMDRYEMAYTYWEYLPKWRLCARFKAKLAWKTWLVAGIEEGRRQKAAREKEQSG